MKGRAAHMLIEHIRRDGGTQIRGALDEGTVADYAAVIKAKAKLPDVGVFFDGTDHWLWDGFHRIEAELRAGAKRVMAEVKRGTQRDAILAACGANAAHGLRRSNADKRRAVETLLADAEWGEWSNRAIAKVTQVSDVFVGECRERLRIATTEQSQEVTSAEVQTFAPAARQGEAKAGPVGGDEGAGGKELPRSGLAATPPAPDEPDMRTRDRLIGVERLLRDAQAAIAPCLARGEAMAVQAALTEALTVVRKALEPPKEQPIKLKAPGQFFAPRDGSPLKKTPHVRVVLETPDGDVPFEPVEDTEAEGW